MAYIQPNTSIWLLKGINWSPNYDDTVYFANKSVQYNYMKNKAVKTYEAQSYQRHSKNSLRILDTADNVYECNYLMFQNTSYGNKWFYAFITDVEYINDNTTEITYEIDIIQTWLWDLELGECFVEREIPVSDGLYENLVPENVELGDYVSVSQTSYDLNATALVLTTSKIRDDSGASTNYIYPEYASYKYGEINGIYYPLAVIRADTDNSEDLTAFYNTIKTYVNEGHSDDIVNIQFVPQFITKNMKYAEDPSSGTHYNTDEQKIMQLTGIGLISNRYYPKNKKLYSYPYCTLNVSNQQGQIKEYHWEDFDYSIIEENPQITFKIWGTFYSNPCITVTPKNYKGIIGDAFDYAVTLTNFPPAPWICDTFKAYLAQNKASIATSILSDIIGTGLGIGLGSAYMTAHSVTDVASTIAKISDMKSKPNTVSNLSQTDAFNLTIHNTEITFTQMTIKAEMAKIIDDYFSAYGYAQHKIKVPNINARKSWSYVQTKGCILKGSCPSSIKANISSIFDKGIRFWQSNEIVGDYSRDNSP